MNKELFDFIEACPTPFHTVAHISDMLSDLGYTKLCEGEKWEIVPGKKYFVTRNHSSIIAFRVPASAVHSFMISASHDDFPTFFIKPNAEQDNGNFLRIITGQNSPSIYSSWLDRPLSVAGRVSVMTDDGIDVRLVDFKRPCLIIPNVAIHMNRSVNDGAKLNAATDMVPIYSTSDNASTFKKDLCALANTDMDHLVSYDLMLYNPMRGCEVNDMIIAPHLDDLMGVFGTLKGFCAASDFDGVMPVFCVFDNEEVGSATKQGADSTFLYDTLIRVCEKLGLGAEDYRRAVSNGFMVSCDNSHCIHPNHPEFYDKNHTLKMNHGVVIKTNANQRMSTDAVSWGVFSQICKRANVPYQLHSPRSDLPGGSTLGNISNTQVSIKSVDIGLPQLAMHSCMESAGARDIEYLVSAMTEYYSSAIFRNKDNNGYIIKK
ncbi:MAG: M18 family aminopeptidase [Clostridia bacterium]|nr:M18 family aminopeptidase [Clostridia bacterium]